MPNFNVNTKPEKAEDISDTKEKNKIIPLRKESGTMTAIGCTKGDKLIVEIYDGELLVMKVNKELLFNACELLKKPKKDQGIEYVTTHMEKGIEVNQSFENMLQAKGDLSGIIIWFNGKSSSF